MMMNLFSIFDPSSSIFNWSLNWMSSFLVFILFPSLYWTPLNHLTLIWFKTFKYLHYELKMLTNKYINKGNSLLFISLFSFIIHNNFLGLFPYIFTSTSHMTMTFSLSLSMWLTFMLFGWLKFSQHMFMHMIPSGTPSILMPFMVLIELTSNIMRPMTLAIRLSANMIAGHLLLTLLSSSSSSIPTILISILIILQMLLLTLEASVAIIQSYVFMILTVLYSSEVN